MGPLLSRLFLLGFEDSLDPGMSARTSGRRGGASLFILIGSPLIDSIAKSPRWLQTALNTSTHNAGVLLSRMLRLDPLL